MNELYAKTIPRAQTSNFKGEFALRQLDPIVKHNMRICFPLDQRRTQECMLTISINIVLQETIRSGF